MRRTKPVAQDLPEPRIDKDNPRWETFFTDQRSPIYRSQLLISLMAGVQLAVDRIPTAMLLDVILVATASREFHDAEIVDDYAALLERVEETWKRPEWTCKVFDSLHCMWASFILQGRGKDFGDYTVQYVPAMVGWYLEQTAPDYFSEELDDKTFTKYLKTRKAA